MRAFKPNYQNPFLLKHQCPLDMQSFPRILLLLPMLFLLWPARGAQAEPTGVAFFSNEENGVASTSFSQALDANAWPLLGMQEIPDPGDFQSVSIPAGTIFPGTMAGPLFPQGLSEALGLTLQTNALGANPTTPSPGGALLVTGALDPEEGFPAIGPSLANDSLDLILAPPQFGGLVRAVSFPVLLAESAVLQCRIYDNENNLLASNHFPAGTRWVGLSDVEGTWSRINLHVQGDYADLGILSVHVATGPADAGQSLFSVDRASGLIANGNDAAVLNVVVRDAQGRPRDQGQDEIFFTTNRGGITPVQRLGNGSYRADLTSLTPGEAVVSAYLFSVDPANLIGLATIVFDPDPAALPFPLLVSVMDSVKWDGDDDPDFSISFEGFKPGDDPSVLAGVLEFQRQPGEEPGIYTVTASGLGSDVYEIGFVPGVMRIEPQTAARFYWADGTEDPADFTNRIGALNLFFLGRQSIPSPGFGEVTRLAGPSIFPGIAQLPLFPEGTALQVGLTLQTNGLGVVSDQILPGSGFVVTGPITAEGPSVIGPANGNEGIDIILNPPGYQGLVAGVSMLARADETAGIRVRLYNDANELIDERTVYLTDGRMGFLTEDRTAVRVNLFSTGFFDIGEIDLYTFAGPPDPEATTVAFSPLGGVVANGTDAYTFVITARDAAGRIRNGGGDVFQVVTTRGIPGIVSLNPEGDYEFNLSSTTPGAAVVSIYVDAVDEANRVISQEVTFDPAPMVEPPKVTITVRNARKTEGDADPAFAVDFSGFLDGDDDSSLGGNLTFTRAPGEDPGIYLVEAAGLTSAEYDLVLVPGVLTIEPLTAARFFVGQNDDASGLNLFVESAQLHSLGRQEILSPGLGEQVAINPGGIFPGQPAGALFPSGTEVVFGLSLLTNNLGAAASTLSQGGPLLVTGPITEDGTAAVGAALSTDSLDILMDPPGFRRLVRAFAFSLISDEESTLQVRLYDSNDVLVDERLLPGGHQRYGFITDRADVVRVNLHSEGFFEIHSLDFYTLAGPRSVAQSTFAASPLEGLVADGEAFSALEVIVRDSDGRVRDGGGDLILIESTRGLVATIEDLGNGTYTSRLTSTSPGDAVVSAYLDSVEEDQLIGRVTIAFEADPGAPLPQLRVIVRNAIKREGDPDPSFDVTYEGFLNGDQPSILDGTLSFDREAGEAAGEYPLTASGLTSEAYELVVEPGVLTIEPVTPARFFFSGDPVDLRFSEFVAAANLYYLGRQSMPSPGIGDLQGVAASAIFPGIALLPLFPNGTLPELGITLQTNALGGNPEQRQAGGNFTVTGPIEAGGTASIGPAQITNSVDLLLEPPGFIGLVRAVSLRFIADTGDHAQIRLYDDDDILVDSRVLPISDGRIGLFIEDGRIARINVFAEGFFDLGEMDVFTAVGPADPVQSTISASPVSGLPADGESASLVTVRARDAQGRVRELGSDEVVLTSTRGSLSPVNDLRNGTYTAELTSLVAETVIVSAYIDFMGPENLVGSVSIDFDPAPDLPPPTLTISVVNGTKWVGDPEPRFDVVFSGFLDDDTEEDLDGERLFEREPGEETGTYQVTATGLTSPRYLITFVPGVLTIQPLTDARIYAGLSDEITGFSQKVLEDLLVLGGREEFDSPGLGELVSFPGGALLAGDPRFLQAQLGLTLQTNGLGADANEISPGGALLLRGPLAEGDPAAVGTNLATDSLDLIVDPREFTELIRGVAFTLLANEETQVRVQIYNRGNELIDEGLVTLQSGRIGILTERPDVFRINVSTNGFFEIGEIEIYLEAIPQVQITGDPESLSKTYGDISGNTQVAVQGFNLSGPILITAPDGFQVSSDLEHGFGNSIEIGKETAADPTAVFIRLNPSNRAGLYQGNLSVATDGAADQLVPLPSSEVLRRELIVTAVSSNKLVGEPDPEFSATSTGFATGEGVEKLNGSLAFSRTLGEAAGSYTITPFGLTSADYTILFQAGTLVISSPPDIISVPEATFTIGIEGSFVITVTGFPTPLTKISGALPEGLSFDENTGKLAGIPLPGTHRSFILTINADNGVGAPAQQAFTLTINLPPVLRDDTLGAVRDTTVQVSAAKLLANDLDPDGDLLTLISVGSLSTQGGVVGLEGGIITYTPPAGFHGADQFTYTASDGRGGIATAVVHVTVASEAPVAKQSSIEITAEGVLVRFHGIPGRTYRMQFSDELDQWQDLPAVLLTAGPTGIYEFLDTTQPRPLNRFYRGAGKP